MRYTNDGQRQWIDRGLGWTPALGNCFTGACADALAPYGGQQEGCGPQHQYAAAPPMPPAPPAAMAGTPPPPGQDGLGNCFTGACPPACQVPGQAPAVEVAAVAVMVVRRPVGFPRRRRR